MTTSTLDDIYHKACALDNDDDDDDCDNDLGDVSDHINT